MATPLKNMHVLKLIYFSCFIVQLDSGQFQENTSEYLKWKEWRERAAQDLRQSVSEN